MENVATGGTSAAAPEAAALLGCDPGALREELCTRLRALLTGERAAPWELAVGESGVAGAGEGVLLLGSCAVGTLLAIYPGTTYQAEDLPIMHQLVLHGNDYVMARRDVRCAVEP